MRPEHRRELRHDKFVDEMGSLSSRARENQRFLLTITVAVVVVALAAYGYYFYRNNREQQAQDALANAIDTIDSPLLNAPGSQQPQQPGAKYKTEAERNVAAEKQFKDLESKYSGTDAADVANLYLARLDAGRGDVAGARKLLNAFIDEHPKHVLVGSARFSVYQIRIENGEAAQVASELQNEVNKSDPVLPADSLLVLLAHAWDVQGNAQKSKEAYRRITTEFPDSPYALEAQRRMGPA
jgi:TolA-binding protein